MIASVNRTKAVIITPERELDQEMEETITILFLLEAKRKTEQIK